VPGRTGRCSIGPTMSMPAPPRRHLAVSEPDELAPAEPAAGPVEELASGPSRSQRARNIGIAYRPVLQALAWLGLAVVIALGSAGIVTATDHLPQTGSRPELSWAADRALAARLDPAVADLVDMTRDVDSLADMARSARQAVTRLDQPQLTTAETTGDLALASIERRAVTLEAELGCTTWDTARETELAEANSPALIDRYRRVCRALAGVAPMAQDWPALVGGAKVVMQVIGDVSAHDGAASAALQSAVKGRYDEALASLEVAAEAIADARAISDSFALVTDVSTLDELLTRYEAMDDALRLLWQLERDSRGRVTPEVVAAMKAVNDAQALLPDSDAFVGVVIYELSGDMTADAIDIEVARGTFEAEVSDLVGGEVFGGP
jgi:hypothetical protein